jgi:Fe-S-cluster containining protein
MVIGEELVGEARQWLRAAGEEAVDEALRSLHLRIEAEVAAKRPLCLASGNCCRFDAFGHRLMVTGLEAASTLRHAGVELGGEQLAAARREGRCPFLAEGRLCGIRTARPMACRTFFCDRAASPWQEALHEASLAEIKALHRLHSIPYRYLEWRDALEACRLAMAEPGGAELPR